MRRAAWVASFAGALLLALWLASPGGLRAVLRERAADLLHAAPAVSDRVVVVDIDRATLERLGPWPWSRATLATLLRAVAVASGAQGRCARASSSAFRPRSSGASRPRRNRCACPARRGRSRRCSPTSKASPR